MAEQKESSPSFRVTYYAFTGRAEPLRLAAALGGIAFEDNFINKEMQQKAKAEGKRRWSGPPEITILDKDGKELTVIGQSNACLRYIGNIGGLYPKDNVQRALVDEVMDSSEDLIGLVGKIVFGGFDDAEKKKKIDELCKEPLPYWLNKFELRLEENEKRGNKKGVFVGDTITVADLKLFCAFTYVNMLPGTKDVIANYKRLTAFFDVINGDEKVKAFKATFAENLKVAKEKQTMVFRYDGKSVYGAF